MAGVEGRIGKEYSSTVGEERSTHSVALLEERQ